MSTPLTSRRRSFNLMSRSGGKTPILSPQTRRSLTGQGTPSDSSIINESPQLPEVANDEDIRARREKRRSRNLAQATSSPRARPVEDNLGETAKLTNDQLATHYINCIKLSTENKITAKNAFNLHLIDHMNEMLKQRCEGTLNFQMAGGTIFASAKIYASRVDAVHSEAYKVLSSLGRGSTEDKNKSDDEGGNADSQGSEPGRKKKKRSKILESNTSALRLKKMDVSWQTDPLDQYYSSIFDVSSTSGLLVNHLNLCPDGITLRFDSDMKSSLVHNVCGGRSPPTSTEDDIPEEQDDSVDADKEIRGMFAELVSVAKSDATRVATICPRLSSFHWIANDDSFEWREDGLSVSDVPGDLFPPHSNTMCNPLDDDDIPMDADFCPEDDLPPPSSASDTKTEPSDACGPFPVAMDAELLTSFMPGEYSYFKPGALFTWEGPNHWKMRMRNTKPSTSEKTANEDQVSKSKKRRKNFYIDYSRINEDLVDWERTKKSKEVTKRIQEKWHKAEEDRLLPTAGEYNILDLAKCVLQPEVQIRPVTLIKGTKSESHVPQVDSEQLATYNYDNPNDKFNYCPNTADDEDAASLDNEGGGDAGLPSGFANCDYNGTDVEGFSDVTMSQTQNYTQNSQMDIEVMMQGDHLVSQPRKVQKISIEYAKKATRIDVRRLKAAMWTLLHKNDETASESDISVDTSVHENSLRNGLESDAGSEANSSMRSERKTFSDMYHTLPKLMPTAMAESLSIPLAFTCLLHLANEKSLKIEANKDMSDLNITESAMEAV